MGGRGRGGASRAIFYPSVVGSTALSSFAQNLYSPLTPVVVKKTILSLALLVFGGIAAHAQTATTTNDNHFGVKVGGSLTNFVGSDVSSSISSKIGFHGGFLANISLGDRLSVQPELLYSMKGAKDEVAGIKATQTLHYIELPILLKAKFNQFFVEAGPQAGVLFDANVKVEGGSSNTTDSNKDQFNEVLFGYAAGFGYQLESGLMLGLRYNGDFNNVTRGVTANNVKTQANARNSAFQVYVGYTFGNK